ncbi:hypothetical protein HF1_03530 [Mycoplasma haemofelis str. Langford 1]|uniref:Uncharacterized protein n=1 Tax=Mycoplasma haemofelis (strain Langford 1) TaxID=941640 RepID=E8ZGU0_MYCHL|nr:hypothetical protein [Mycoplasma haemofelis]CBY92361.1 hypothetical protein HF1_03530 [Mycoplasma haemofelis str. Langford 1]
MNKLVPVLGTAGAGLAGGGAAWASGVFSKDEAIRNKLREEKYEVLSASAKEHWDKILDSYKKPQNKWGFEGQKIENISQLQNVCKSSITSNYSDTIYKAITKWCVVPRTAENLLGDSVSLLGVDDTKTDDQASWKHNVDAYSQAKTGNTYSLKDVTFTDSQEGENTKKLKAGCKTRRGKFTYDVDLDDSIAEIKKWCLAKTQSPQE